MQIPFWSWAYFIAFFVVVTVAGLIIPQILLIAFRRKLFDKTDRRKIHQGAVPRLGGTAFFPAILFSILLLFGTGLQFKPDLLQQLVPGSLIELCFIVCAVIVLYLVGMADDLIGVKYQAKFIAQLLAASLVMVGGNYFNNLHGLFGIHEMPLAVAIPFTALLMVFITNAINLIDGIDGLASGLSAIACAVYGCVFYRVGLHVYGLLAFATLGALIPFFYYNVFGDTNRHKKIFMGDTGALTVGLILCALSIRITRIEDTEGTMNMAVAAFTPLLVPCLDVVRVCLHRIRAHRNPFQPDKRHIHHKLLKLGLGQRVAMMSIVSVSLILTLFNCWLSVHIDINILLAVNIVLWILINVLLTKHIGGQTDE